MDGGHKKNSKKTLRGRSQTGETVESGEAKRGTRKKNEKRGTYRSFSFRHPSKLTLMDVYAEGWYDSIMLAKHIEFFWWSCSVEKLVTKSMGFSLERDKNETDLMEIGFTNSGVRKINFQAEKLGSVHRGGEKSIPVCGRGSAFEKGESGEV